MVQIPNGTLVLTPVILRAGDSITNLSFCSAGSAMNGPTHWWFALYDTIHALISQTADQVSASWGTSTIKTLALGGGPYAVPSSGRCFAGIMCAASIAVPTLFTANMNDGIGDTFPPADMGNGNYNSSLGATAPDPAVLGSELSAIPWCELT